MSNFGSVRSLERGLLILQTLNRRNGLKAAEVAAATSIPRPTVYRLLETLEGLGFVSRDHSSEKWRPTLQAKSLSSGFRHEDWVTQAAVPEMVRLGREILWPLDLVTFNDHQMEIRESTHNISPYSIDHGMVGVQLPVLDTAGGRAYLAFSREEERAQTLAGLRAKLGLQNPVMLQDGPLMHVLDRCRTLGVGYRKEGYRLSTQSISAPIYSGPRVLACLTVIWTSSALSFEKALDQYRDKLLATARGITDALEQLDVPD
ncbi:helix-turn-helix domain-containing protein [Sulfitobacter sp. G21635-S1]|uniref:helix-turn-helix domain-containing protein n=1 Tax=Sulfitobacter sp. G21635-S1 TaxID=3014043 RepID=UPI0022AF1CA8|nr:helix-turn-helix domain-containing protein [Sulfitobacter sp. G21635-S1]MCZ4258214.1 helix-turn-helix domain-containing protein [Sulfitobacter sp. G21635-S1]